MRDSDADIGLIREIRQVGYRDKVGFVASDVHLAAAKKILVGTYFYGRAKKMTVDVERAADLVDQMSERLGKSLERLVTMENDYSSQAKKTAGSMKEASERIGQGILRIQKSADFDSLERYVTLLERAATAMDSLAKLEATGKLDKIASALR